MSDEILRNRIRCRDEALEESCRIAEAYPGGASIAATIRARKYDPWAPPTHPVVQILLGNRDTTD